MAPCDENFYSCSDCSRIFINQTTLQFHQKAHQEEKLIELVNRRRPVILLPDIANRIRTVQGSNSDEESVPYVKPAPRFRSLRRHHLSNAPKSQSRVQQNKEVVVRQFAVFGRAEDKGKARSVSRNQWGMHKCLQCGIIFNKEINLRLHRIKRHNNKSAFSCRVCGKKFLSKVRLESHQSSHPELFSRNPAMPELEYNNGSDFNNSSASSASQPPELNPEEESSQTSCDTGDPEADAYETCLTCGDAIAGPDILIHINTHIQAGQTDCLHCDFEASHPKDLLDHMTVHYGLKTYACTVQNCGKAYHWKHSLARHYANSHPSANLNFQCSSCDASFSTLREERRHALTHITDGEAMSTTDTVVAVVSEDSEQDRKKDRPRPYSCQQCEARFTKKKFLKAHEAIHARRTPEYQPKPSFVGMRRVHHQPVYQKPRRKKNNESSNAVLDSDKRACKTCGDIMLLSDLLVHIRTHVTKDQRQCELCQHVYANVESLREHMHTHYGLEPHKCTICHKTYSLKQSVLNHIIRNHKAAKPLEYYTCMIPATPKAIREAVALTPKKFKNGKLNGSSVSGSSNHVTSTTSSNSYNSNSVSSTPSSVFPSHFGIIQQQFQVHSNHSPLSSRGVTPSTSANGGQSENGFSKKSLKPVNFQCNFCSRVFTTKFSVQRHEAKLHNYVETDHKRHYKTTYATAEDSSDAYAMDSQGEMDHAWIDGKSGLDGGSSHTNGDTNGEIKFESLRSEIRNLLLQQEQRTHEQFLFKEIPASLY